MNPVSGPASWPLEYTRMFLDALQESVISVIQPFTRSTA